MSNSFHIFSIRGIDANQVAWGDKWGDEHDQAGVKSCRPPHSGVLVVALGVDCCIGLQYAHHD